MRPPATGPGYSAEHRNLALEWNSYGNPLDVLKLAERPLVDRHRGKVRVSMHMAPINPSDLLPIEGAYANRVRPPAVAGYEGVGEIVGTHPDFPAGGLVLPLRGPGTWQRFVDCDPDWMVRVPDDIPASTAARAYINPLAAAFMLRRWPVQGCSVLLTAATSSCAAILAQWARSEGAAEILGVARHQLNPGQAACMLPILADSTQDVRTAAARTDIVFDAVGGLLAECILEVLRPGSVFVSYGLLSGQPIRRRWKVPVTRFHLRDEPGNLSPGDWHRSFDDLWIRLRQAILPPVEIFPIREWRRALTLFGMAGRAAKPVLCAQDDGQGQQ